MSQQAVHTTTTHFDLPKINAAPLAKGNLWETEKDADTNFASSRTISTYPLLPGTNQKDGDPIADYFYIAVQKNRTIVALADGCNWGRRPQEAALKATQAFKEYVLKRNDSLKDLQDAGHFLLRAFCEGHNKIVEGKEDIWEAGTTTLLGGLLLELELDATSLENGTKKNAWGFLCASVGDCKAFLWNHVTGEIVDVTAGNRLNVKDVRDPGGRLGPYLDGGSPDLRNLYLYYTQCHEGDVILVVSDGVHDNFDPLFLGKSPKDAGLTAATWEDADRKEAEIAKSAYRKRLMEQLLRSGPMAPKDITDRVINHCIEVTKTSREYMEQNPQLKQPSDYIEFPGKMDHTTCVTFAVGGYNV